jgi:PIN domain nuclease of toxin-antitoxin system
MADEHIVDAHSLIWYVEDSPRLGVNAGKVMDDPASILYLPVIALAEACWAAERGRCKIPVAALLSDVDADPRMIVLPLDREILDLSLTLTSIREMHDQQIVATALVRARLGGSVALLTCDTNITASGLVPIVW